MDHCCSYAGPSGGAVAPGTTMSQRKLLTGPRRGTFTCPAPRQPTKGTFTQPEPHKGTWDTPRLPSGGIPARLCLLGNDVIVRDAQPGELPEVGALRVAAYRAHGFLPPASVYAGILRDL